MITLVLPAGSDHTAPAHGAVSFEPYREDPSDPNSRWFVDVPDEVGRHLMHNGGYYVPDQGMRRRLSGEMMPIIHEDGLAPFSVSFDGDSYASEPAKMPNGARLHVAAIPQEAHAEVLGTHPGLKVLSIGDYAAPKRGRPLAVRETADEYHGASVYDDPDYRLEGGDAARVLLPADQPGTPHPEGSGAPEEAVRADPEGEKTPPAEHEEHRGSEEHRE